MILGKFKMKYVYMKCNINHISSLNKSESGIMI